MPAVSRRAVRGGMYLVILVAVLVTARFFARDPIPPEPAVDEDTASQAP
jgi:hypothetical protein